MGFVLAQDPKQASPCVAFSAPAAESVLLGTEGLPRPFLPGRYRLYKRCVFEPAGAGSQKNAKSYLLIGAKNKTLFWSALQFQDPVLEREPFAGLLQTRSLKLPCSPAQRRSARRRALSGLLRVVAFLWWGSRVFSTLIYLAEVQKHSK